MTASDDGHGPRDPSERLTPSDVHDVLFTRAGLGRRGYDEVEVDVFLERVQGELTRLLREKADLRNEVTRLRVQRASTGSGSRAASAVDTVTDEQAQLQAVRLLAAAQQTADTYVADAEEYGQRLVVDAREHSEQIVAEAREAARRIVADAERVAGATAARVTDGELVSTAGPSKEELDQQVAYLETFGQGLRVQLRAYLQALLRDVEEEWGRAGPGVVLATPPALQKGPAASTEDASPPAAAADDEPDGAAAPAEQEESADVHDLVDGATDDTRPRPRSRKRKTVTLHSR